VFQGLKALNKAVVKAKQFEVLKAARRAKESAGAEGPGRAAEKAERLKAAAKGVEAGRATLVLASRLGLPDEALDDAAMRRFLKTTGYNGAPDLDELAALSAPGAGGAGAAEGAALARILGAAPVRAALAEFERAVEGPLRDWNAFSDRGKATDRGKAPAVLPPPPDGGDAPGETIGGEPGVGSCAESDDVSEATSGELDEETLGLLERIRGARAGAVGPEGEDGSDGDSEMVLDADGVTESGSEEEGDPGSDELDDETRGLLARLRAATESRGHGAEGDSGGDEMSIEWEGGEGEGDGGGPASDSDSDGDGEGGLVIRRAKDTTGLLGKQLERVLEKQGRTDELQRIRTEKARGGKGASGGKGAKEGQPGEKPVKNRMGQRQRRKLLLMQFGEEANHVKKEREAALQAQERGSREGDGQDGGGGPEELHPSWQAKKKAGAGQAAPQGMKIAFGEDGEVAEARSLAARGGGEEGGRKRKRDRHQPGAPEPGSGADPGRERKRTGEGGGRALKGAPAAGPVAGAERGGEREVRPAGAPSYGDIHPSQLARMQAARTAAISTAGFAGKKITFD